jgi:pimeloyl-ACP methyl ester carboxylesterase
VRTAFPATGGFDEQVPLFCLHSDQSSSRTFATFLPEIADVRSVYAPDLPGLGESDPAPTSILDGAAGAISDLADDLRLRQIDLLGLYRGARVSLELAAARPTLVRRLVLVGLPTTDPLPAVKQQTLIMRTRLDSPDDAKLRTMMPNSKFADIEDYASDLFAAAPKTLAKQIGTFLAG